jgi:rubrerythrin
MDAGDHPMQDTEQITAQAQSPVDDATYDLLQALTSKLEAIEAYQMYAQDDGVRDLFERLGRDEMEHAEALLEALRERLANR